MKDSMAIVPSRSMTSSPQLQGKLSFNLMTTCFTGCHLCPFSWVSNKLHVLQYLRKQIFRSGKILKRWKHKVFNNLL